MNQVQDHKWSWEVENFGFHNYCSLHWDPDLKMVDHHLLVPYLHKELDLGYLTQIQHWDWEQNYEDLTQVHRGLVMGLALILVLGVPVWLDL